MDYRCGAITADGTPCERPVSHAGGHCPRHTPLVNGRYSKHLPRDIADRLKDLAERTKDTRDEEALVQWMLQEYLDAYAEGAISRDQLYTNLLAGVETLSRAVERREKVALARERAISPQELVTIITTLGDIVQRRVSNMRERQLVAKDFANLIQGRIRGLQDRADYQYQIDPDMTPEEIVAHALTAG